jgi:hypothetical protein
VLLLDQESVENVVIYRASRRASELPYVEIASDDHAQIAVCAQRVQPMT